MNTSVLKFKVFLISFFAFVQAASGQLGDSIVKLNMDAVYNRPLNDFGRLPVAIGGYLETNSRYAQTDGINEGLSFQARRMTVFLSSTIAKKIKFFSEVEFEDGAREINLETAIIDFEFHPLLNLRGGILLNPIGSFNQNHDGPRWNFIDRPVEATHILPATLSNAGFGLFGKWYGPVTIGYEVYLTNGFNDRIISNSLNRTSLAEGKNDPEKFEESNSGLPLFTGKIAIKKNNLGEAGLSYMTGIYNKWKEDGIIIAGKRNASAIALDLSTTFLKNITLTAEVAFVNVEIPATYSQTYGTRQLGAYADITVPLWIHKMFDWEEARLEGSVRMDYADFNRDHFRETGNEIHDEINAITGALAFRPVTTAVIRFNYTYQEQVDLFGNPAARTAIVQFGFAGYF